METITVTIRIDENYRKSIEVFGVNFEDYLTGVLLEHMMKNGDMGKMIKGLKEGRLTSKLKLHNVAGVGETMTEILKGEDK